MTKKINKIAKRTNRGNGLNKKANISPLFFIIAGFLLFIMVSCAMGNGVIKAFKSYDGAEQSFDDLSTAMSDVYNKSNNLALKLVGLELEEDTALFIFLKDTDLQIGVSSYGATNSRLNVMSLIEKPIECPMAEQCVCLCKDFELKAAYAGMSVEEGLKKYDEEYKGKYTNIGSARVYTPECGKGMECVIQKDVLISNRIGLTEIMSVSEQDRIDAISKAGVGDATDYIYLWEGGFVLWRLSQGSQKTFQPNQFMSSKYLDMYIINNNVNVKLCLDPACGKTTP